MNGNSYIGIVYKRLFSVSRLFQSDPFIVVGCHRSGTSFLADKIADAGGFIGNDINSHSESVYFMNLNEFLFEQYQSSWDAPSNLVTALAHVDVLESKLKKKFLRSRLSLIVRFIGVATYLKWIVKRNERKPWGWKDPRNSITLSIWLRIFPNAKIIYVFRNGESVANSLYQRELDRSPNSRFQSLRCKDKAYCLILWSVYEATIHQALTTVDESRIFRIDFDRLISDRSVDKEIAYFIHKRA